MYNSNPPQSDGNCSATYIGAGAQSQYQVNKYNSYTNSCGSGVGAYSGAAIQNNRASSWAGVGGVATQQFSTGGNSGVIIITYQAGTCIF
ncbi:hypothetical protein [Paucibacter soli]|uniref:hypothetical protein n=1 Tax=Paucibacter soli TaxID=3133433 RepID=UPI0030970042